jgi:Flp pilus assembly protein TadG
VPVDAPFPSPLPSREKGALLRRRGAQRGQAIVLIAVMLAVLIGMAALAIDGARAYSLRRDLQDAVDGAALAAGDTLQQTGSYTQAEQAASNSFGQNMALYAAPGCTPGYGNPGAASYVVTCTYSDGTVLTQTVMSLGAAGSRFMLSATKSLSLQFGRILTNGASPNLTAGATAAVNNLLYTPTLAALNQAGCGGKPGIAMSLGASGTLTVNGTIVASGAISVPGGANLRVAGDIYARCQVTVPGLVTTVCYPGGTTPPCTFPSVAGLTKSGYAYADPNYPAPPVTAGSRGIPGNDVVISPGTYAANPNFGNRRCYFLAGGVYKFQGGYSNNGALVSNELKPPDEPNPANNQQAANPQFWNIDNVNCAGAFDVQVSNGGGSNLGTWGVEVTSTRSDLYSGTNYPRESAPSRCQSFAVHSAQTVQLKVSNVPGATSYNIYLSSNGCNGPFGLVGNLPVTGAVQNDNTRYCPFDQNGNGNNGTSNGNNGNGNGNGNNGNNNCSLGSETLSVPAVVLPTLPLPNILALWGTSGAYPPDNETPPIAAGLPNQNADRGVPPAGDKANENQCSAIGGTAVTCPGPVTPGAVSYYIPNGSCLTDPNGGDNYVFSGYQYNWMAVYEPGVGQVEIENTCANVMGASTASAYIGLVYMPAASLTIPTSNGFRTEATGGVIADTITFTGTLPTMTGISDFMPVPPAARLVS